MILETKLTLPQPKAGALLRTGLIDLIKNNLDKKLILICAGAGYGKTTLLGQLVKSQKLQQVYYSLDQGDSDLLTFYSYLVGGLEKLSTGLAARCTGLLKSVSADEQISRNHELLMGTLINELVEKRKEEIFIILDDYQHLAENSPVHPAINYFTDHLPDTAHVIIASRSAVPFPSLAKWTAKQDASTVTRKDLAFTAEEIKNLLVQACGRGFEEDELLSILDQTEGWITGIHLIISHLQRKAQMSTVREMLAEYLAAVPFEAGESELFEYFADEILAGESGQIKDFLVQSSILNRLTPDVCNAILKIQDSAGRLKDLEKRNMFISHLGAGEYRYHRLFRDFLQKRAPGEVKAGWHARAGAYFSKVGQVETAVDHFLCANDFERAGILIAAEADKLKLQGRYDRLSGWLQQLPGEIIDRHPKLLVVSAALHREQGRKEEAAALLNRAETLAKRGTRRRGNEILADALHEHSVLYWINSEYVPALIYAQKALKYCPASNPLLKAEILNSIGMLGNEMGDFARSRNFLEKARAAAAGLKGKYISVAIDYNMATLLDSRGETKLAFEQYVPLVERIKNNYHFGIGQIFCSIAKMALEYGKIAWAEKCLDQGWKLCRQINDKISHAALNRGYGALQMQYCRWQPAEDYLKAAMAQYDELGWNQYKLFLLGNLGTLKRFSGEYDKAKEYLEKAQAGFGKNKTYRSAFLLTNLCLTEICLENFEMAGIYLKNLCSLAKKREFKTLLFGALLARAAFHCKKRNDKKALSYLKQVVHLSRVKGYDGLLALELKCNPGLATLAGRSTFGKQALISFGLETQYGKISNQPELGIRLFGSLQLYSTGGRPVPIKWRSRKSASLLAYLLLNRNRVCNREELIGEIWPRLDLKQALDNLRPAISLLKKSLMEGFRLAGDRRLEQDPVIIHREKGYRISPALICRLDAEEMQDQWRQAKALAAEGNKAEGQKKYQRCLELYCDDFLSNLGERWCEERREVYRQIYLSCLKELAAIKAGNKEFEEALRLYKLYIKREPCSETVRIEYWWSLHALGREKYIKKDYLSLKRTLDKLLGTAPQLATEEAYRNILFADQGE